MFSFIQVIDAYLYHLIKEHQMAVHQLCAVVGSSLFAGQFRCVSKMKFPAGNVWLCPVNTGAHWILVIINMLKKAVMLVDPLGQEGLYKRKIMRNWRNFLKTRGLDDSRVVWQCKTMQHNQQLDSSSCGVLILKFAEDFLLKEVITEVQTTQQAVSAARMEIASSLLTYRKNAEDYCISCSMLQDDADRSMIEMVQCDLCSRWAHFECAEFDVSLTTYICKKCRHSSS
ncbi:uncharacterized protein LOC134311398 [Trichomycterus rosablanca]|uniref:uncharacterized protein LOC134311398 n=1 Tax=Trichomycterus rosablanca TaxID=2290929 RepID=UPI002F354BF8